MLFKEDTRIKKQKILSEINVIDEEEVKGCSVDSRIGTPSESVLDWKKLAARGKGRG